MSLCVCVMVFKLCIRESEERSQVIADGRQSHVNHRKHHHRTHVSNNSNYFTYIMPYTIEKSLWLLWEDC